MFLTLVAKQKKKWDSKKKKKISYSIISVSTLPLDFRLFSIRLPAGSVFHDLTIALCMQCKQKSSSDDLRTVLQKKKEQIFLLGRNCHIKKKVISRRRRDRNYSKLLAVYHV